MDIRATREALGLTQGEFAALVGVSRKTVNGWEKGAALSPERAAQIAEKVGEAAVTGTAAPVSESPTVERPAPRSKRAPSPTFADPEAAAAWSAIFEFPPEPAAGDVLRELVGEGSSWPEAFERLLKLGAIAYRMRQKEEREAAARKVADPDRIARARQAMEGAGKDRPRQAAARAKIGPAAMSSRLPPPDTWDGVDDVFEGDD